MVDTKVSSLQKVSPGMPISAAWANNIIDTVNELRRTVDRLLTKSGTEERYCVVADLDEDVTATATEKDGGLIQYDTAWYDSGQTVGKIADSDGGLHLQHERVLTHYIPNAGRRIVVPLSLEIHLAKLDATLNFESSAAASIYEGNPASSGTFTDSGVNVTVYDWLLSSGQSISAGKQVIIFRHPSSRNYVVIGAQCPT
jgi:hypothetical protein